MCVCVCVFFRVNFTLLYFIYIYIYTHTHTHTQSKVHPRTGHEGPKGELMYNSTLPSISALDAVGGPQGRSGRVRKISPPTGFEPQTLQPARSMG